MNHQRRTGVLLSYANLAVSMAGNLALTPALLRVLGNEQYGLYQIMRSLGAGLLMLNLGVSAMVARGIARSRVAGGQEGRGALTVGLALSVLLAAAAALVSAGLWKGIPIFYQGRYSPALLAQAQRAFLLFAAASVCHILTDAFSGCIIGRERFVFNALVVSGKYALRFGLMAWLIHRGAGLTALAGVDGIVSAAALVCLAGYALLVLRERPGRAAAASGGLMRMTGFSLAVLAQETVHQLNTRMDPILLGRLTNAPEVLPLYTSALMIYGLYHQMVTMLGGYYLARASVLVASHADGARLTDMLIRPGRFQAAVAMGIIAGFALFGRRFIELWIGRQYLDAYGITLLLMIPAMLPLAQSAALSILDAQFRRTYRSVVLLLSAAVNVFLSIVLIRVMGHWGAAIATAVSTLLGQGVLMNRYYARRIGLEIPRLLREMLRPALPAGISAALCLPLCLLPCSWPALCIQCAVFYAVYAGLLLRQMKNPPACS